MKVTINDVGLKTATVVVPPWGERDAGKVFVLTEMPAVRAEKWGYRMFLALKGSQERIPENVAGLGMVGVAIVGLNVFLRGTPRFEDLEPLLDEMMACVQIARDRSRPDIALPLLIDQDIRNAHTIAWLRSEVLELHTGFSATEALSRLISAATSAPAAT